MLERGKRSCASAGIHCAALAHWVLGRPDAFLLTTGDVEILPWLLDAAERFTERPSDDEMTGLASRAQAEPLFV